MERRVQLQLGSFTDLSPASFVELPSGASVAPKKDGTWTLLWNIEQRLLVDPDDPDRGLGLYVQTGYGDGNPNPIRWFLSVALCGNSPVPGREGDLLGIGVYDVGLSAETKSLAPGLRDERGVELFYKARITPGCHLTPDLQVLHPGLAPVDTTVPLRRPPQARFLTTGGSGWVALAKASATARGNSERPAHSDL